jgi:electron transport complex protein RnfG
MKSVIKPGIVLLVVCVIAAAVLGYVNAITAKPIQDADAQTKADKMNEVYESAGGWGEEIEVKDSIITGYTPSNDGNAYAFSVETKGFSAGLKLMVGINKDSEITGVAVVDCSNETPGLGANAAKDDLKFGSDSNQTFRGQFAGKTGTISVSKNTPSDTEIKALTGATITSKAVTEAVNTVIEYYDANVKEGGAK